MNERIKELRKTLHLTQQEFANRIGVKRNTVATYEGGRNTPVDAVASLICKEFNVNEDWLRNGSGSMFVEHDTFSLDDYAKTNNLTEKEREILRHFMALEPPARSILFSIFENGFSSSRINDIVHSDPFAGVPDTPEELERLYPPSNSDSEVKEVG